MFSEKGGRECGREGRRRKKKRRKSNYSAGIIINSQLVPRNYSFEGHGRQKGKGDERKREKEEENGSFVEKLTTPFPHIAVAIVLTERTSNTTNGGPRLSSRARVALFTIFRPLFLPLFFSRPTLLARYRRFCDPHESFRKICQFEPKPDTACEGRHSRTRKRANDEKEEGNL